LPVELLTYAALAERLKISPEAARSLAKRHRFPRSRANDGKALISVDLDEIAHRPLPPRSPAGDPQASVDLLRNELAKLEALAATHRSDFERERGRAESLMVELLRAQGELMAAKESAARMAGELDALRSRPWWRRLVG
jgi:hypothetical protein